MFKPFQIVVGRGQLYDPVLGETSVSIPILNGVEYDLEVFGAGRMPRTAFTNPSGGGISLTGGDTFGPNGVTFTVIPLGPNWTLTPTDGLSNGWNVDRVLNALFGRVGWRQPTETGQGILNGYNTTATSGRYFQSFHSLVTPRLIRSAQENAGITDSQFNDLLIDMQKDCILATLNTVFNKPQLVESKLIFETDDADGEQIIANAGNFVGCEVEPGRKNKYTAQIKRVMLYFDADVTFNLYLFHSSKKTHVKVQSVTAVGGELTEVSLNGFFLDNKLSGEWYLGYFQDDLGAAKAIHRQYEKNCFTVLDTDFFESPKIAGQTNFQRISIGENRYNYGLNAEIAVFKDFTQMIEAQPHLFDEAIGLQMAVRCLELYQNSVRSNRDERISGERASQIQTDLNVAFPSQEMPVMPGLKSRLKKEFDRINENFFPRTKSTVVNLC